MELRAYIDIVWRWLWLIVLGALLAGGTALVVSLLTPPAYEAEAGVAVVRSAFQLELEPRFKTLSEEELAQAGARVAAEDRRQALALMVQNEAIAPSVYAELQDRLPPTIESPSQLVGMVEGEAEGDMIRVKARARDPQLAADLANAWARGYERHVNSIYGGQPAPAAIQQEARQAKQAYDAAQARLAAFIEENEVETLSLELEEKQANLARLQYYVAQAKLDRFLRDNRINELNRQLEEKQAILTQLQGAKRTAVEALIDEELQAEQQILNEYLRRRFQNRFIAFQKEQDAKSQLLSKYLDAAIQERQKVFDAQLQANLSQLSEAYARRHHMDRLLADARALQERLQSGANSGSAVAANTLALLLLQTSAFTESADPITSQLDLRVHIDELSSIFSSREQLRQDLDNLIALLEGKRAEYDQEIQDLSRGLLNSENLDFLEEGPLAGGALMEAVREKYPDLFTLGDLSDLAESVGTDTPLMKAVEEQAQGLLQLRGLEETLSFSTVNAPTSQAILDLQAEINGLQADLELARNRRQELTQGRELAWADYQALTDEATEVEITPSSGAIAGFQQRIAELRQKVAGLKADLELLRARQGELTRARDLARESYTVLANKAEEVKIAATTAEGTEVRFAVTARVPRSPVEPRTRLNTLLASVVGAMLALGVAFLLAFMDDTLRLPRDVSQVLELPTLGLIPRGATINEEQPITLKQPTAPVAEATRMLRTGLRTLEHNPHSLLVASADRGEGKTSVAANLAVVMAQTGRSVVLIDADLRHPMQHELFDVDNTTGLTRLLGGGRGTMEPFTATMLNTSLQATGVASLQVLPAGPETDRPAELLESPAMGELLAQLRDAADVVILDSPAAGRVTDAAVLASQVDSTLLVVAIGATPAGDVHAVRGMLEAVGGQVSGVVLNNVPAANRVLRPYADGKPMSLFGFPVSLPGSLARGLKRLLMLF